MNEKESILNNWKVIVIIFIAVVSVLIYNGVSFSIGKTKGNYTQPITPTNSSNIIANNTNIDPNKFFSDSVSNNYVTLMSDLDCVSKAAKNRNFGDTAKCGKFLNEDSDRLLRQTNSYNISISLNIALDEYKKSLEDYKVGGANLEAGAISQNGTQMYIASESIKNGTEHVNKVMKILYGNVNNSKINQSVKTEV